MASAHIHVSQWRLLFCKAAIRILGTAYAIGIPIDYRAASSWLAEFVMSGTVVEVETNDKAS